jgi:hypothetical protein
MQDVRYYQYFKGERASTGFGKEELLLRAVQRLAKQFGDPKFLNSSMAEVLGVDQFCNYEPHLVGAKVFGFQKRKANVLLGFEGKLQWLDKVNFFHLHIATRFARANYASCNLADVVEELSSNMQEDHASNNLYTTVEVCRLPHVTAI